MLYNRIHNLKFMQQGALQVEPRLVSCLEMFNIGLQTIVYSPSYIID